MGLQMNGVVGDTKKSLAERAYEAIREAILTLRLEPGQAIYEAELGNMLEMSRTPIREAVRLLAMEELIEVLPQRGLKVALISEGKVEETRFVREILEIGAIRSVVQSWDSKQLQYQRLKRDVQANLEQQRQAQAEKNAAEFLVADEWFHRLLLQSTGNMTLVSMVTKMRYHLNRVRTLTLQEFQNSDSLIQEHEVLFDAIQGNDESTAIQVLTAHLRRLNTDIQAVKQKYPSYFVNA
ncbi:GntR family transcriptional regulator [Alicyclobacillus cycloheptanicus]|uniref:DNA-binding GntR family transcriptional regulator n=1 Tax=Alicyclobacillus cycloheptanicus TaxID=1457 RepID=A0ABT9XHK9_9BACL|nr:GntR family transcriptional regulator [Alicyclobacillus cycloheptanicus]MDQ0189780.1 DNA-binding GntR family transcriptional regulator [Alicyclobacillus cycloheptanicus]WDM01983.1 GntR family transcriptional regulator [Alicyclobacillus cycloheptanicus]